MIRWYIDTDWHDNVQFQKTVSCAYRCHYHLVFNTKYRAKVLTEEVAPTFVSVLRGLEEEEKLHLFDIYIGQDHVHILFGLSPKHSVAEIQIEKLEQAISNLVVSEALCG